jgi:hypothetical protein
MLMYRVDPSKPAPVPVECPDPQWPNYDADGERIHSNTHFASIGDAWDKLQAECDAGVKLGCARVTELRRQLARLETALVEDTLQAQAVREARAAS